MKNQISIFLRGILILLFIIYPLSGIAQENENLKKLINMSFEDLMKVKITTAGKRAEEIKEIPASIVIITRDDIEKYGYKNLKEILSSIPGMYLIEDYSIANENYGIRGFWSGVTNNNMIILVNGINQVYDYSSSNYINKISAQVQAIDRIEIIRGPMSVIYGSGANYGVINIITNEINNTDKLNIISGSIGSGKTYDISTRFADKIDEFSYILNSSVYSTGGINQPVKKMVSNYNLLPVYGIDENYKTGGRLEWNKKYFNFSGCFKKFSFDMSYVDLNNECMFLFPSPNQGSDVNLYSTIVSINYKNNLSDFISIDGKLSYSQNSLRAVFDLLKNDFYGIQRQESKAYEFEFTSFIKAGKNIDITLGLYERAITKVFNEYDIPSLERSATNPTLINNYIYLSPDDYIHRRALYSQINYSILDNLKIVTGIRLEQMPKYKMERVRAGGTQYANKAEAIYNETSIDFIPRAAIVYSINEKNIVKLLFGKAINRPSFLQNTMSTFDVITESLKPENINTIEMNYITNILSIFTLNCSIFQNSLDNLIVRMNELTTEGGYKTWTSNSGKMLTQGIEFSIEAEPINNLNINISDSYQKTNNKQSGYENITPAYSPKNLGYAKILYSFNNNISLSITGNYVGEMEALWDETIKNLDGSTGNRIGKKTGEYFIFGANFRVDNLFYKGLYFSVKGSNLFDREVHYPVFTNNQWAVNGTIGEGVSVVFMLGIKF
jgi:outer membrane cobalamin receptor